MITKAAAEAVKALGIEPHMFTTIEHYHEVVIIVRNLQRQIDELKINAFEDGDTKTHIE